MPRSSRGTSLTHGKKGTSKPRNISLPTFLIDESLTTLQPKINSSSNRSCVSILLYGGEPDWIVVDCSHKFPSLITCQSKKKPVLSVIILNKESFKCPMNQTLVGQRCYSHIYIDNQNDIKTNHQINDSLLDSKMYLGYIDNFLPLTQVYSTTKEQSIFHVYKKSVGDLLFESNWTKLGKGKYCIMYIML